MDNEQQRHHIEGWTPRQRNDEEELTDLQRNQLKIRNWLNIIFMITAVVGVVYYVAIERTTGMYIVFAAMAVKIVESSMRMIK